MEQIVLIQVSDVHFDANLLNQTFGWIGGYRAHDPILCMALPQAIKDVRQLLGLREDEHPFYLLSGDLTASGLPGEFAAGHLFFRGTRPADFDYPLSMIGLRLPHSHIAMIPGNHDHWDGSRLPAGPYNEAIFGREFRTTPWKLLLTSPNNHLALELFAIDSNSGMKKRASLQDRLRARGRVSDEEFAALRELLEDEHNAKDLPQNVRIVRAITVHHPFSINSNIPMLDAQPLDENSRDRLLQLARKQGVFAVLNGHTHRFYFEGFSATAHSHSPKVWEMRCASTLQGPASEGKQGFLVHQLKLEDDNTVAWNVWLYRWDGSRFARPDGDPWLPLKVKPLLAHK